jgi:RHS repeat-associated protein
VWRSYYYAGGKRVAMREQRPGSNEVYLLLGDNLGSTSISYRVGHPEDTVTERYKAWGELRDGDNNLPTDYTYTGQYSNTDDFGLMFYGARWYDPVLSRFAQADSIIPNSLDPASYDRYAYVRNSPVNFIDPSGNASRPAHDWQCGPDGMYCYNGDLITGFPNPDLSKIPNKENRGTHLTKVWEYYQKIRDELFLFYGLEYLTPSGKIKDDVLMSMILAGEIGSKLKFDIEHPERYGEALEALQNQYYGQGSNNNMQCGGPENGGCTLAQQLMWLTDVEAWYYGNIYNQGLYKPEAWMLYYPDAVKAASHDACYGPNCYSWMWGDTVYNNFTVMDSNGRPVNKGDTPLYYYAGIDTEGNYLCFQITAWGESNYPGNDIWNVHTNVFHSCPKGFKLP